MQRLALGILALAIAAGVLEERATLPSLAGRTASTAHLHTADTALGRAIEPRVAAHPGESGIHPLRDALDAFAARMRLARTAERTLDLQYYIWNPDLSGMLLFDAVREAADRGVRVRLLLDDNNTAGLDEILAALDSHENIEVRLFNPFVIRRPRLINYLVDFSRLNRRMHNKSFTADNQATIIGGRNVGDEYFNATEGVAFVDFDVLAVGPVVRAVSADFDRYWASASSYPVDLLLPPVPADKRKEIAESALRVTRSPGATAYLEALRNTAFVQALLGGQLPLEWAPTRMVSDDPAKALGRATPGVLLPEKLHTVLGRPEKHLELVSAYFVPATGGTETLAAMARRNVELRILTNSLEASDVAVVHAGYLKRRKALLEAGVRLFELRRLTPRDGFAENIGPFGSSAASLHAKTFAADGRRIFIGSFNFDPRSAALNTEMGFVIESPVLAQRIEAAFRQGIPERSYEVRLDEAGDLYWIERRDGELLRHDVEPGTSIWQRASLAMLSMLPIEWLL